MNTKKILTPPLHAPINPRPLVKGRQAKKDGKVLLERAMQNLIIKKK